MIAVDTNILVRLFIGDDARQKSLAEQFMAARSQADPAFIGLVVLVEMAWILRRFYEVPAEAILSTLDLVVSSPEIVVERHALVTEALKIASQQKADLADTLIAMTADDAGAKHTVTFDRRAAKRIPGMELLK